MEPLALERGRRVVDAPTGLFVTTLGPREREALALIEQRPGMTVAELAGALDIGMTRVWQIVGRLELGRVRREDG